MAVVAGQRRTDNIAAHQRAIDMHAPILEVEPDTAPLLQITRSISSLRTGNPEFKWSEYAADTHIDAVNNGAGYASGATSIVVDTGELFYEGAIIHVPRTAENMRVTAVSTNTLTVVRGYGASSAAALVDNDVIFILGYAAEEGALSPQARSRNPVDVTNYTEITRTAVEASRTELSSDNETSPHDWDFQRKIKAAQHKVAIEKKFWFGSPGEEAGSAGKIRTTGGVFHFAQQNRQDAGGGLTKEEVETFIRTVTRFSSKKLTVFVSPLVSSVLSSFALGTLQTFANADTYGVKVMKWVSTHGELNLVVHDLFIGPYAGYAVALDFSKGGIRERYLEGGASEGETGKTHLRPNIQENDRDGRKDEYLTENGLQFGNPEHHGVLYGVTSAA